MSRVQSMRDGASRLWRAMSRKKNFDSTCLKTPLSRCLNVFDLTLIGLGNMAGSGVYVLTGTVIRDKAGPSTFLAFLLAGITAFVNALCYAELGSRIHKAGSAYTYTYIASGEFLAFLVGWSIVLEYILSAASVARGWSGTIDAMAQSKISNGTISVFGKFPESIEFLGGYPDFLGAATVIVLGLVLSFGTKLSARLNGVVTILNLCVILFTTVLMFSLRRPSSDAFPPAPSTNFLPYGFGGMVAGAGTSFYAFIGFDAITVSGEEAIDPKKSVAIATAVSVSMITIVFVLATASLTYFIPWWTVNRQAAFTAAMHARNIEWATYITGFGSLLGIGASLFMSLYAMPRIVYAMAADGLLPSWMGYILPATQVPVVAMAIFGGMAALLTFLCDIHTLAEFLSIGTLIAYTIVCMNVCILRYSQVSVPAPKETFPIEVKETNPKSSSSVYEIDGMGPSCWPNSIGTLKPAYKHVPLLSNFSPGRAPIISLVVYVFSALGLAAFALVGADQLITHQWWAILATVIFLLLAIVSLIIMMIHEQNQNFDTFKVPFVPITPCVCIFLNMCLIVKLSPMTWIRFVVWLAIGLIIYFSYGWWHSKEGLPCNERDPLLGNIDENEEKD